MPEYRYELRRGDEVIATGHLNSDQPFEVEERTTIGGRSGTVRSIKPSLGKRELRLVPTCGALAEPSDGLEPSTPSLPWRCSTN
jgi:hypothetical protein